MKLYLLSMLLLSVSFLGATPATTRAQESDDGGGALWSDEAVDDSYRNDESESWYESRYTRGYYGSPYYRNAYGWPYYGSAYYGGIYRRGPYAIAAYGTLYDESPDLDDSYLNRSDRVAIAFDGDAIEYRVARPSYYIDDDVDVERYYVFDRDIDRDDDDDDVYLPRERLTHLRGEVLGQRVSTFGDRDGYYVIARLRTDEGQTEIVNLGRHNELRGLGLQLGDEVSVLGHRAIIDGQPGLVAQHVLANDQTIRVGQTEQPLLR